MIELTKQYKTEPGGYETRILCVDGPDHNFPVVAVVNSEGWELTDFEADGTSGGPKGEWTLVEVKPEPKAIPFSEIPVGAWFTCPEGEGCCLCLKTSNDTLFTSGASALVNRGSRTTGVFFIVRPTAPIKWERV